MVMKPGEILAYAVVATGERARYANLILKKGLVS